MWLEDGGGGEEALEGGIFFVFFGVGDGNGGLESVDVYEVPCLTPITRVFYPQMTSSI